MPIITLAPILADPIDNSRQAGTEINPFIFLKGSLVYQVLSDSNSGFMAVFKSTAAGVNSAALDSANAPALTANSIICYSDPASSVIHIGYRAAVFFSIVTFDTATDTYSAPITSTVGGAIVFRRGIGLFYRSGSALHYVVYPDDSSGFLSYRTIDGAGTTSAAVHIITAATNTQGLFYTAFDESSGIALLFYLQSLASQRLNCITLSAADAIGAAVNITSDGAEWAEAVISSGTLNVAWVNGAGSKVYASSATVATAPTFSAAATIATITPPAAATYISITSIAGMLTVLWCLTDLSFNPGIDEIDYSQFIAAAWTAPAVFYDAITNPPAGGLPYPNQFLHTLQVLETAGGGWFAFTAMETSGACTGFILVAPGVAGISILCPVAPITAFVGVPYVSDAPVVAGDTPPDTFVLLTGPLWMTIDSLTGVVSGTPTAEGSVTYTIQVTDSLGNVAVVAAPCPLTVSNPIPPPPVCIQVPATGQETLVLYNEPLEQQGT